MPKSIPSIASIELVNGKFNSSMSKGAGEMQFLKACWGKRDAVVKNVCRILSSSKNEYLDTRQYFLESYCERAPTNLPCHGKGFFYYGRWNLFPINCGLERLSNVLLNPTRGESPQSSCAVPQYLYVVSLAL
jgi:hypothetical protein